MNYLNEISQNTAAEWLQKFNQTTDNIFLPFQESTTLSKKIYDALNNNNQHNIRLYLGLDNLGNPKVIALGSYLLQAADYNVEGHTDLILEGKIYELYADEIISISLAKEYIKNWKVNSNNILFKFGFLIPRPNAITFFEELKLNSVRLFFGIDTIGEIKLMMQKPNGGIGDVILNYSRPCPFNCPLDTRMID